MCNVDLKFSMRLVTSLLVLLLVSGARGAELKDSLGVVSKTNLNAVESQKKIDELSRETQGLLQEYRKLSDGNDYQADYARELEELASAQQQKITSLKSEISRAKITRQRIVPLMRSMTEALEKFVVLDLPFHHEQRINSVLQLKLYLNQPELSVSSKFRLLLEAYQLEQDYGGSIEAWRAPLQFEGAELSVQYLRVGRVALYFQTLDGESSSYWSAVGGDWVSLDARYNREIAQAIRVAKNQVAPQLLPLPLLVPEANL
ncbi:MAG: DUF3450 domain-containing protein [Proteobacteria bacterium]|nr:DUF3450 domain-containing protein [Pseudomonadota bacterium]